MTETAAKPRATPSAATSLTVRIAQRYGIDADKMLSTLKATAFRQRADHRTGIVREATNEEMLALLTIADRYNLDPFTRELFAFLDVKSGAIVPVVSPSKIKRNVPPVTVLPVNVSAEGRLIVGLPDAPAPFVTVISFAVPVSVRAVN